MGKVESLDGSGVVIGAVSFWSWVRLSHWMGVASF